MNLKSTALAAGVALVFSSAAHAESFFQFEAGLGLAQYSDRGDGTWTQWGAPRNSEDLRAPIVTAGVTGPILARGKWGVDWHADYQYLGTADAQCLCTITDQNYDNRAHSIVNH